MQYTRHKAREYAIQALYQMELLEATDLSTVHQFLNQLDAPTAAKEFALAMIEGTYNNLHEIDQALTQHLEHWKLNRLSVLVRNILRLATYELQFHPETPASVVIDEALELAKDFVDDTARRFINSVLQKVGNIE